MQPAKGMGGNSLLLCFDLAPGDFAVAVGIQADQQLQVGQRDVPLDRQSLAAGSNPQVAIARFVCQRQGAR